MRQIILFAQFIILITMISSCCTAKKAEKEQSGPMVTIAGPQVIIYKTKKDYSKLVPISLSEDKKTIVSYPDVKDVYYNGNLAYPTPLHDGFLLDNRGITKNTAFINLTYDEYSKLAKTPTADQLIKMIIDTDPLTKMYSCGIRSLTDDIEKRLNDKIDTNDFSTFVKMK
ncbi:MAG: hypothetical protein WCI92_00825 [Bacteroidota bacterium]